MPARQPEYPVRFTARGLVDAFDATDKFPGACTALSNLLFDRSNPELMVSRPGVQAIYSYADFITPGVVSVQVTVGSVTYGMISTGRNAGKDEPFAYDNAAGAVIAIAGVTNANTPTSPSSSGPWTPPTMASVGVYLIVTHPGYAGGATKFGWFDLTNPAAPTWNAGDTASNGLPSVPVAVANFNNRAYFACANSVAYTDVLTLTRTAGTQALTIGDLSNLTALSGLPIQTTSSGVVQALLLFKAFQIWQVTGDPATVGGSDLAENYISLEVGCTAPRSIVQSPLGTYFANFSGPYIVDQFGILRALTHGAQDIEPDIQAPFNAATEPTRMAGGYVAPMYRVCMDTLVQGVQGRNDYWFSEYRRRWVGPHTFSYDCASKYGNYSILCSNANPAKLYKSEITPGIGSLYTDDGAAILCNQTTSTFPKTGHMVVKQVVESTQELASAGSPTSYAITALDEQGTVLNNCAIPIQAAGTLWGAGVWGGFLWASSANRPLVYTVPWTAPLVFKKMALQIMATASAALSLGTFYARYKEAGYTNVR